MNRKEWRKIIVHKYDVWFTAPQYIPQIQQLDLQHHDRLRVSLRQRMRILKRYGPRYRGPHPFFIDKCAMHGCDAPAMYRYHGKTYCHSGAIHMQRLNAKIQAFRMAKVADNLSQIIMLGESFGEGEEI